MTAGIEIDGLGVQFTDRQLVRGFVAIGEQEPSAVVAGGDIVVFLETLYCLCRTTFSQGHHALLACARFCLSTKLPWT